MKKIILAASVSLALSILPAIGSTNPFVQLVNNATTPQISGACGDPNAQPASQFCQCFDAQMTSGCESRGLPPTNCKNISWLKNQVKTIGVTLTCQKYPPKDVSFNDCVTDINFFLSNC